MKPDSTLLLQENDGSNPRTDESAIGGFFELELPPIGATYHDQAIALATGRSCLQAILSFLRPNRCYAPHYTCDATLAPFREHNIEVVFYELDANLLPVGLPPQDNESCWLVTNYWGLQREAIKAFSATYHDRLIVDDTHDFFSQSTYPASWSFTSARKYFGVPDGAYLFAPIGTDHENIVSPTVARFQPPSLQHLLNRKLGRQAQAFREFQLYETKLPSKLARISEYSETLLSLLDFDDAKRKRQENFDQLAQALHESNRIKLVRSAEQSPFVFPYLPDCRIDKRSYHSAGIFVPTLWPDVIERPDVSCEFANEYSQHLIPLPIDHRYDQSDMQRIIDVTKRLLADKVSLK